MSEEQLRDEDDEAIAGLEPHGPEGTVKSSRSVLMRFPPQQFKLGPGDKPLDPVSERGALEILALDAERGTLDAQDRPVLEGRDAAVADARGALQHQ